LVYFLIFRT